LGDVEQLSSLQDPLTSLDFFLLGFLKERIYKTKPVSVELKQRITDVMSLITVDM